MGSIETLAVLFVSYAVLIVVHRFSPVKDV
jgi:hypothetical protein